MKGRAVFEHIPEEACRELEAIVGPEYITTDPNMCKGGYGMGWGAEVYWFQGIVQPPAAIILPNSTEEVAKIVRVCNRYGIPFIPTSSHCVVASDPAFAQNAVQIDLKRMNELKIDEKNMNAIVGPGIIASQISAEANKRDMYYIVTGGGAPVGALCNHFCFGFGHFCYRAPAYTQRRLTGIEWVSPEGIIYRLGSFLVKEPSSYWGDGPGPDAVGLLYGIGGGWCGAMGIITRVSFKLYPFQPEPLEPEGMGGDSGVRLPPRVRYYNITFPARETLDKAIEEISKADIASVINIVPAFWRTMSKAKGVHDLRNEFFESWDSVTEDQVAKTHILRVLLLGRASLKQLEYEERVLMDIVNENGGTPRATRQVDEATFRYANTGDMWMMTGVFGVTGLGLEVTKCTKVQNKLVRDRLYNLPYKGDYLDQKGEMPWYLMWRRARDRYMEIHVQPDAQVVDPQDPKFNLELTQKWVVYNVIEEPVVNTKTGVHSFFGGITHTWGIEAKSHHHFDVWLRRFKQEFDPKGLAGTAWPYAIDKVVESAPQIETEELKEVTRAAEEAKWMGNP
jgi:hypothetical protein